MKNKIYICGDSFSSTDPDWPEFHWSERLQVLLPQYKFVNLAYPGATNLSISAQIEKSIIDPDLKLVILNASDIFRIDLPNKNLKRKDKTGNIVFEHKKFTYNDFKKIGEKIYTEVYKNSFSTVENFYDMLEHEGNQKAVITSFGMWALTEELSHATINKFSNDVSVSAINYFKFLFDLNTRFQNDLALIEGKIYKLAHKKIPFLYNLGGLTNKKSFLNKVFPHVIEKIDDRYSDLKMYYSSINFFDISEDSYMTDENAAGFHITTESAHIKIAEHYQQRINDLNAS